MQHSRGVALYKIRLIIAKLLEPRANETASLRCAKETGYRQTESVPNSNSMRLLDDQAPKIQAWQTDRYWQEREWNDRPSEVRAMARTNNKSGRTGLRALQEMYERTACQTINLDRTATCGSGSALRSYRFDVQEANASQQLPLPEGTSKCQ